ncbi:MAG: hypothetical protein IPO28_08110 [Holophagaceae bacterium]|nr:hypothetical protein [Holophagaceae bacterium]
MGPSPGLPEGWWCHAGQGAGAPPGWPESRPGSLEASRARLLDPEAQVVALDEVQFMDEGLIPIIENLANRGVRVIAGGLDQDSNGEPFGIMPLLLAKAEYVTKLQAICMVCGALAGRTQRMVHTGGQVLVGAAEAYEARCRHCHEVPHATGDRLLEDLTQRS